MLDRGSGVVTSRCLVQYVVTEHGVVNLKGKSLRQRAEALISIAHPRFREELEDAYRECFDSTRRAEPIPFRPRLGAPLSREPGLRRAA